MSMKSAMSRTALEASVRASREQYEASKKDLRMRLAALPNVSERLGVLDTRLLGFEQQALTLRAEIKSIASTLTGPSKLPAPAPARRKVISRSVSWHEDDAPEQPDQGNTERKRPQLRRRSSCLSSKSFADIETVGLPNGRVVELSTNSALLGPLECILSEPMGKQLLPDDYVATGLVICLHGHPPTKEILEEWGVAVKQARWLELGLSVALPNLQMSSALTLEDLECLVEATLELLHLGTCVLVGKAWGALKAVELAASSKLAGKIEGVILISPSSPPPMACSSCNAPTLILWARDDEVEAFQESETWMEALCVDERQQPTTLHEVSSGGHHLHRMLESAVAVQALQNFTAASLLAADLEARKTGEPWSERAERLFVELPGFLRMLGLEGDEGNGAEDAEFNSLRAPSPKNSERAGRRLSEVLPQWIDSGMPTSSE